MKTIKLTKRLSAIVRYVKSGSTVIDVGTDHGYIPVFLAQNGIADRMIASDVRRGPLRSAMKSAEEYGVSDKIEFVLADGLSGIGEFDADTVIIAGMGGETIIKILNAAPWTCHERVELILQPQSKLSELNVWLAGRGYAVTDGELVEDDGKLYVVLCATKGKTANDIRRADAFVNRALVEKRDPLLPKYVDGLISKMTRAVEGMKLSASRVGAEETEKTLAELIELRKEIEKWRQ